MPPPPRFLFLWGWAFGFAAPCPGRTVTWTASQAVCLIGRQVKRSFCFACLPASEPNQSPGFWRAPCVAGGTSIPLLTSLVINRSVGSNDPPATHGRTPRGRAKNRERLSPYPPMFAHLARLAFGAEERLVAPARGTISRQKTERTHAF